MLNLFDLADEQERSTLGTDPASVEVSDACTHGATHASVVEDESTNWSLSPAALTAAKVASTGSEGGSLTSAWREVPQALYLSWSAARQAAYCAARDEDAAKFADSETEAQWLLDRAKSYREMYA